MRKSLPWLLQAALLAVLFQQNPIEALPTVNGTENEGSAVPSQLEPMQNREQSKPELIVEVRKSSIRISNERYAQVDEEFLCRSIQKVIYPRAAQNKAEMWQMIVNNNEYRQGVRVEECVNEGETCSYVAFPEQMVCICKQHYIYLTLESITSNGTVFKDHFKMPSSCVPVLKLISN